MGSFEVFCSFQEKEMTLTFKRFPLTALYGLWFLGGVLFVFLQRFASGLHRVLALGLTGFQFRVSEFGFRIHSCSVSRKPNTPA